MQLDFFLDICCIVMCLYQHFCKAPKYTHASLAEMNSTLSEIKVQNLSIRLNSHSSFSKSILLYLAGAHWYFKGTILNL